MNAKRRSYDRLKRTFDFVAASAMLVITLPVQLVLAALVLKNLGAPVLFTQQRPGRDSKLFRLYKFRTMLSPDEKNGRVLNEDRMTSFGKRLRASSLDELPSLWNVVLGDMSLVGPRPLRSSYLGRYSPEQARRHEVRPGVTGYAQVLGRNALSWDDRLALDVQYVEKRSFWLDVWILYKTLSTVVTRVGVVADGEATMSEFFGPERTPRLELVPLSEEHLATRVEWLSDPRVRAGVTISFMPDADGMRSWFAGASNDHTRYDWVGVDPNAGRPISMCGFRVAGSEANLYIYVDPRRHGMGFGRDTMTLLIARARSKGVRRLTLETSTDNIAAVRLYESLGFVRSEESTLSPPRLSMKLDVSRGHGHE
ncbi:hypothetical protein GCM10011490_22660 [Pseudoclavibacter endophyticus]|uniref:GNAT family N-acetyltransferase n=1 Tax=Pseudoclavibacter endophyticus TaxID=1778590 RepID=UPI00166DFA38|nr:GNAT family N-acetyltransferase [Pseudoclavibacter endophyticus]GGA71433.1 hypothetical protein GCM10011490_22660 [Pseudoclavibacter endophyticus]